MTPGDLVELGAVRGAYGLKGWVRITPFVVDGVVLESVHRWWLRQSSATKELVVQQVRRHGESILAKWHGCESKEAADMLKSATIAVARSDFPPLAEGEHYLNDVIGYRVVNRSGVELGTVSGLRTGNDRAESGAATQWLEVTNEDQSRSLLIPLVDQYIDAIETKLIRVDWQNDW
ncbi:MAG TPA: ribosome maturation factor RimM [Burkholderiaceae bacterium]|nr:ribosome maturation factor RimM [Burkholderiaceae bacterium]